MNLRYDHGGGAGVRPAGASRLTLSFTDRMRHRVASGAVPDLGTADLFTNSFSCGYPMAEPRAVIVNTTNFGEIEVPEDKIISFNEGIPGFPRIRKFAILGFDHLHPFQYLQSLEEPPISFLLVNPFLLNPAYEFQVGDADMVDLQTDKPDEVSVYAVATIPEDPSDASINLMAPILINEKNRCGKQVILLDGRYSVRHPLLASSKSSGPGPD